MEISKPSKPIIWISSGNIFLTGEETVAHIQPYGTEREVIKRRISW